MQYGLSEKFDGIVRMVLVVAAVVRDVLEKSIAISNLAVLFHGYERCRHCQNDESCAKHSL